MAEQFSQFEEESIVSLAFDQPEFFITAARFIKPEFFQRVECQLIIAHIINNYEQHRVIPSRNAIRSALEKQLTEDDENAEAVFAIIDKKSQPRDVPIIKDVLLKWVKQQAYGLLYSDEAMEAFQNSDFAKLEQVFKEAQRVADVNDNGFWLLKDYEQLFSEQAVDHHTCGFAKLDKFINCGGPSVKEVFCWMGNTNIGKSVFLCHNALTSLKGANSQGEVGQNVLLITFELSSIKTAMRILSGATMAPMSKLPEHKEMVTRTITSLRQMVNGKQLLVHEMAPDECSVDHIYALLDRLKRIDGWRPDVIVIDYMDLMVSRNKEYNKDDYSRQRHVASELRGLAKNELVLIFTATQTNRSGASGEGVASLDKAADSFAKQFSLDYVVTINQDERERAAKPPKVRLYIAKNRNGPKFETVNATINYDNMVIRETL